MSPKKNDKHLIGIIQIASYMLLVSHGKVETKTDKKFTKEMANQSLSYLKKEVKKLKRI